MYSLPPADERTLTVGLDAIVYNLEEVVIRSERQLSVYRSQIKVHGPCGAWEHPMVELALGQSQSPAVPISIRLCVQLQS